MRSAVPKDAGSLVARPPGRSHQRQPLLAARQVLVAAAHGVAEPLARERPLAGASASSTGTPRVARSRMVSATTPIVVALVLDEVPVDRGAVAGHDDGLPASTRPSTRSRRERPVQRVAVGAEPGHAVAAPTPRRGRRRAARRRRAPARPGRRRCGRGRGGRARRAGRRGRARPPRRTCVSGRHDRRSPGPRRGAGRRGCRSA